MIGNLIKGIFGSSNERELKRMAPIVDQINRLEPDFQALSDEQLKAKTPEFKERIEKGESLDELGVGVQSKQEVAGAVVTLRLGEKLRFGGGEYRTDGKGQQYPKNQENFLHMT